MFTKAGIPVLTADSLPEVNCTDLHRSRIDVVNNYHARMLSSAILAAQSENLEYVQVVSFGCGHDAYLSDEIVRMMKEISGKTPLILKVDESDIQGPLGIRVRSFLETVEMGREKKLVHEVKPLAEPYPVKFTKKAVKKELYLCQILLTRSAVSCLRHFPHRNQGHSIRYWTRRSYPSWKTVCT